jgi:hypothetical protein
MANKPKKTKKRKGMIRVKQKVAIVRKDSIQRDSARNDTLPKAPTKTVLPTNGITFKVKMRKK